MEQKNNSRVLVVDDDAAIRTMMERVLQHEHFHVECASDGFEAIEKLSRKDYDVIILDMTMPRLNGADVLRHLEHGNAPIERNVILMTANVPPPELASAPPVAGVLTKPFDIRRLVEEIRDHSAR